jgi:hypothetical protein
MTVETTSLPVAPPALISHLEMKQQDRPYLDYAVVDGA